MRISLLGEDPVEATEATLVATSFYWLSSWFFTIVGTLCALQFLNP
jgi:hypothetical protein